MKKIIMLICFVVFIFSLSSCKLNDNYESKLITSIFTKKWQYNDNTDLIHDKNEGFDYYVSLSNSLFDLLGYTPTKFYEAKVIERKRLCGYLKNDVIEEIFRKEKIYVDMNDVYDYVDLDSYYMSLFRSWYKIGRLDIYNGNIELVYRDSDIPNFYNDKKLIFVYDYFLVELNNGRKITLLDYPKMDKEKCIYEDLYYRNYYTIFNYKESEKLLEDYYFFHRDFGYEITSCNAFIRDSIPIEEYNGKKAIKCQVIDLKTVDEEYADEYMRLFDLFVPFIIAPKKIYKRNLVYYYDVEALINHVS